jgi:hypothetical protein
MSCTRQNNCVETKILNYFYQILDGFVYVFLDGFVHGGLSIFCLILQAKNLNVAFRSHLTHLVSCSLLFTFSIILLQFWTVLNSMSNVLTRCLSRTIIWPLKVNASSPSYIVAVNKCKIPRSTAIKMYSIY